MVPLMLFEAQSATIDPYASSSTGPQFTDQFQPFMVQQMQNMRTQIQSSTETMIQGFDNLNISFDSMARDIQKLNHLLEHVEKHLEDGSKDDDDSQAF